MSTGLAPTELGRQKTVFRVISMRSTQEITRNTDALRGEL